MQDYPGAPGSARKGSTRTVVPAARGGAAAHPMAPGHDHPLATPVRLPGHDRPCAVPPAPDHDRSRARHTRAPGHERPPVAPSSAVGHDRPRATPQAPGHDVPLATPARAPGHGRPCAAPSVPVPDRSRPAQRAPGHGRPCAAQLVPDHYWSHHAPMAPPRHAPARAGAYVPIAAAPLPARVSRLLRIRLTATPHTLISPQSRQFAQRNRAAYSHAATYPQSRRNAAHHHPANFQAPTYPRFRFTTHQVHPAIQVPPRPRSCSTACTGFLLRPSSRAPPPPVHRNPSLSADVLPLSTWWRGARGVRPAARPAALDPLTRPHPVWPGSPPARRGFRARRCRRGPPPGRWRGSRGA